MADGTAYSPADKAGKNGGTSGQQLRTLAEIREAIAENDGLRLDPDTTDEERRALEEAALALRAVERELVPRHPRPRHIDERPCQIPRSPQESRLPAHPLPHRSRQVVERPTSSDHLHRHLPVG